MMNPSNYIGRSSEQVEEFIVNIVHPKIKDIDTKNIRVELKV